MALARKSVEGSGVNHDHFPNRVSLMLERVAKDFNLDIS
jgi:hypothetical protein